MFMTLEHTRAAGGRFLASISKLDKHLANIQTKQNMSNLNYFTNFYLPSVFVASCAAVKLLLKG